MVVCLNCAVAVLELFKDEKLAFPPANQFPFVT